MATKALKRNIQIYESLKRIMLTYFSARCNAVSFVSGVTHALVIGTRGHHVTSGYAVHSPCKPDVIDWNKQQTISVI